MMTFLQAARRRAGSGPVSYRRRSVGLLYWWHRRYRRRWAWCGWGGEMWRDPARLAPGYAEPATFFGTLVLILDGVAGFVAARYIAVVNGVWAGIMVASLDTVFGQLMFISIL